MVGINEERYMYLQFSIYIPSVTYIMGPGLMCGTEPSLSICKAIYVPNWAEHTHGLQLLSDCKVREVPVLLFRGLQNANLKRCANTVKDATYVFL